MLNKLILVGRLTRDVEIRHTAGGTTIGKGGIAVDSYAGKDANGDAKRRTLFLDFVAFEKTAENLAKHFAKGAPLLLEGELTFQSWDDKDTGKKRTKHEMRVERFAFLPQNSRENGEAGDDVEPPRTGQRVSGTAPKDYGDIPF